MVLLPLFGYHFFCNILNLLINAKMLLTVAYTRLLSVFYGFLFNLSKSDIK